MKNTHLPPSEALNQILVSRGTSPVSTGVKLGELLKRPQISYQDLDGVDCDRPELPLEILESVEIELKYEGYIRRQKAGIEEMRRVESKILPNNINYQEIKGLRLEAAEKLSKVRPQNIGQARRISGVSPADISVLMIWLAVYKDSGRNAEVE